MTESIAKSIAKYQLATGLIALAALELLLPGCNSDTHIQPGFFGEIALSNANSIIQLASSTVASGQTDLVTLTTEDQNGAVYVSSTPLTVSFSLSGGTSTGVFSAVTDHGNGTYTALLTGATAGTASTVEAFIGGTLVTSPLPTVQVSSGLSISVSGSLFYYTTGDSVSITPTLSGGVTAVSISPGLANSLSLNSSSGVISGTTSGTLTPATYTLTATNGSSQTASTTLVIGIFTPPTISVSGSPFTFTNGTAISAITPTLGSSVSAVSISPNITNTGLSFNSTTGVISGTPTSTQSTTTYTLTASNPAGATSTQAISVTVNDVAPTISLSGSPFKYTTGNSVSITPTLGGAATSVSITPALGNSLSFNTSTGAITGTASGTLSATTYTLTASNSTGQTATVSFSLTIYAPPTLSVSGSPFTFLEGTSITPITPTLGSSVSAVSISPSLASIGLAFNTTTGVISGTPSASEGATTYTLTAFNPAGATSNTSISITVNVTGASISYTGSSFSYTTGGVVSLTPTLGPSTTSVSISPALGNSLSLNTSTGVISGTTSGILSPTAYTVTATNASAQTASTTITIGIYAAPTISIVGSPFTFTKGTTISTITPTLGSSVSAVSISPVMSFSATGLSFNSTTGVISGAPAATQSTTSYTLTASNPAGATATSTISVTINDVTPTISISGSPFIYTTGSGVSITPTINAAVTSVSINPALGNSLSFSTTTGAVTGTSSGTLSTTSYTMTASNSTGQTATATFSLAIYASPTISVSGSPFNYETGTAITSVVPTIGSSVSAVSISPNITSTGLSFNTTTGTISGTPTSTETATTYTLTASNPAGATANTTISVTINAALSISPTTKTLAVNDMATFTAANGVPGYTYSVNGGGAGGTINSSGVYTAPAAVGSGSDTIKVTDAAGATATATVTINPALTITPTSATVAVAGTQTFTAANGVSGYTYSVNSGGAGGTINSSGLYTAPNLVGSGSDTVKVTDSLGNIATATVTVTPGPVSQIVMTTQPATNANETAATNFSVVVTEEDSHGNTVTTASDSLGVAILNDASGIGATLTGGSAVSATNGVASFTLAVNYVGTGYTLQAGTIISGSPYSVTSNPFNVVAGLGSQLVFITNPSGTTPNSSITPAMTVQIEDAGGNAVSTSGVSVTLGIASGAGTLSGTLSESTSSAGLATFSGISLNNAGSYTLSASANGYSSATSQFFYITSNTLDLEVPIEMLDNGEASQSGYAATHAASQTYINPSNFTGSSVTYSFEIVATNSNATNAYNVLMEDSTGATFATLSIPASTATTTRFRTTFTPSSTVQNDYYKVVLPQTAATSNVQLYAARIIVDQTNANSTQIYVPMFNTPSSNTSLVGDNTTSTTGSTVLSQGAAQNYNYWTYNAGDFATLASGTPITFYADVFSLTSGISSHVALWDVTAGAMVSGSEISDQQSSSGSSVSHISMAASSLTDTHLYTLTLWTDNASNTAYLKKAGISLLLQNLTKAQAYYRVARAGTYTSATIIKYQNALLDLSLFTSPILNFQCLGNLSGMAVTNNIKLYDSSVSSAVSSSGVSFNSTSLATQPSGSLSINNTDNFTADLSSAAATVYINNCMAVITVN